MGVVIGRVDAPLVTGMWVGHELDPIRHGILFAVFKSHLQSKSCLHNVSTSAEQMNRKKHEMEMNLKENMMTDHHVAINLMPVH